MTAGRPFGTLLGVLGLGFWVWGFGFGVLGLGFGVWGLMFRVWGLGFRRNGIYIYTFTYYISIYIDIHIYGVVGKKMMQAEVYGLVGQWKISQAE